MEQHKVRKTIWIILGALTSIMICFFVLTESDNKILQPKEYLQEDHNSPSEKPPVVTLLTKHINDSVPEFRENEIQERKHVGDKAESYETDNNPIDSDSMLKILSMNILQEISNKTLAKILESSLQSRPINMRPRPQSLQVIISTTWRSGSTFLEQLLESHPGIYNHYEPLLMYGFRRFYKTDVDSGDALELISSLLKCKYNSAPYLSSAKRNEELFSRNLRLWQVCKNNINNDLCYFKSFLEAACSLYPWSIMKLVRSGVEILQPIMDDPNLNSKIIFLTRDPRAIMNSRLSNVKWCNSSICANPKIVCNHMERDLITSLKFKQMYPNRVHILRYEDLALAPTKIAKDLFTNIGLDFDPAVTNFIAEHTTKDIDVPWTTHRESSKRVMHWTTKMELDLVHQIQNSCSSVMKRIGYLTIKSLNNVAIDDVLGNTHF